VIHRNKDPLTGRVVRSTVAAIDTAQRLRGDAVVTVMQTADFWNGDKRPTDGGVTGRGLGVSLASARWVRGHLRFCRQVPRNMFRNATGAVSGSRAALSRSDPRRRP